MSQLCHEYNIVDSCLWKNAKLLSYENQFCLLFSCIPIKLLVIPHFYILLPDTYYSSLQLLTVANPGYLLFVSANYARNLIFALPPLFANIC